MVVAIEPAESGKFIANTRYWEKSRNSRTNGLGCRLRSFCLARLHCISGDLLFFFIWWFLERAGYSNCWFWTRFNYHRSQSERDRPNSRYIGSKVGFSTLLYYWWQLRSASRTSAICHARVLRSRRVLCGVQRKLAGDRCLAVDFSATVASQKV